MFDNDLSIFDNLEFTDEVKRYGPGSDKNGNVEIRNAQSWNSETHPKGQGDSFLVQDAIYDAAKKTLRVTYRNGKSFYYDNITPEQMDDFAKADSKGRWAIKHLFPLAYRRG